MITPTKVSSGKAMKMVRWAWQNAYISLIVYFAIMTGLYLLFTAADRLFHTQGEVNGISVSSFVMLFVVSLVLFAQSVRFGLGNGVSRRSIFFGLCVHALGVSALLTLADSLFLAVFGLFTDTSGELLNLIYGMRATGQGASAVSLMVGAFACNLFASILGFFIAGANYRMNRVVKLIVSIGVPGPLLIGTPLVLAALPAPVVRSLGQAVGSFFSFMGRSPYHLALPLTGTVVVLGFFCWLLIRRAPLKVPA